MDPPDRAAILDLCTLRVKTRPAPTAHVRARDRLHPVLLPLGSPAIGRALGELALPGVVVVLFGSAGDVERAEASILG